MGWVILMGRAVIVHAGLFLLAWLGVAIVAGILFSATVTARKAYLRHRGRR